MINCGYKIGKVLDIGLFSSGIIALHLDELQLSINNSYCGILSRFEVQAPINELRDHNKEEIGHMDIFHWDLSTNTISPSELICDIIAILRSVHSHVFRGDQRIITYIRLD